MKWAAGSIWKTYLISLEILLKSMSEKLQQYRGQAKLVNKRLDTSMNKIGDYKRILMQLGSNNVSRLQQLISVSLNRGSSARSIANKITQSIRGLYSPHVGFTQRDIDLAFLCKSIGGPRLLFTFQKAFGLVSERTLRRMTRIPKIFASLGTPSSSDINHNISAFFDPLVKPLPEPLDPGGTLPGHVLMFDDIALESKCRYCFDRRSVMGLCREHSHNVKMNVTDFEVLQKIKEALSLDEKDEKRVCIGKNATVVAIAPYARREHYFPVPLILSPTDGKEKWESLASWIRILLDEWALHEFGESKSGPVWAIASDGDATFRRAHHAICMEKSLDPESDLGKILCGIPGLNVQVSREGISATADPKHIFKRFATNTRTEFMVLQVKIQNEDVLNVLAPLPQVGREAAEQLLDPVDKQNVPKAVSLIQHLASLKDIPDQSKTPSAQIRRRALEFIGQFFAYFTFPFIKPHMSLGDQLISLATYGHIAAALWLESRGQCMSSQLYADSQAVVKNIFFTVARLQVTNPKHEFFLIHEGSDRLEKLFADCRTLDHGRNFDIRQLSEKIGVAALINSTYERNSDLDRGHRRLNLDNTFGVDRVNPKSWKGNVVVGNVKLRDVWYQGQEAATKVIREYLGDDIATKHDFKKLFSNPDHDLLRPEGKDKYIGYSETKDQLKNSHSVLSQISQSSQSQNHAPALNHLVRKGPSLPDFDATIVDSGDISDDETTEVMIEEEEEAADNFEDQLPATFTELLDDGGPDETNSTLKPRHTIPVKGKEISIDSLVSALATKHWKRVTMRTLRVQERALEHLVGPSRIGFLVNPEDYQNEAVVKIGDLVAFPARVANKVSLAVLEVTGFQHSESRKVSGAQSYDELIKYGSQIHVLGQILHLSCSAIAQDGWEWTRRYVPLQNQTNISSKARYSIKIPSILMRPLNPSIVTQTSAALHDRLRWLLKNTDLKDAIHKLQISLDLNNTDSIHLFHAFPNIPSSPYFPYCNNAGEPTLDLELPKHLKFGPRFQNRKLVNCFMCEKELEVQTMRNHVGVHILRVMRDQEDPDVKPGNEIGAEPCGFCGLDGCSLRLSEAPTGGLTVTSSCIYQPQTWNIKSAARSTPESPCSNVPIYCHLCPSTITGEKRAIWKYNTSIHALIHHPQQHPSILDVLVPADLPGEMLVASHISKDEERYMGILEHKTASYRH
ncbi:hypothetical protein NP233_g7528 [Leucocoprinus birnbaumii]|uniref:C2H2-type domain-containing protein n=1 Tax=Leucocoprinus birnbaumii TaxID=56174 RepID=A0AAD5VSD0_9AGAR|nr:hypothetical protein NP233_g7528 [Leucocoprinus birnbaumii]